MTAASVRLTTPADLPAVAALFDAYRQFYEQAPNLPQATRFISERMAKRESVILVAGAAVGGELTGFCQLYPGFCSVIAQPIYTLYDLYVIPAARQSGTGRALMVAAQAHAKQQGMARLDLTTARDNHPAQALYESLGWVRDEVFFAYSKMTSS